LISKLGYCAGFLIVILGRKQLYTENTLTAVVPLLNRRTGRAFLNVLRLLVVVCLANLAGAHLFALFAAKAPVLDEPTRAAIREIGHHAVSGGFLQTMCKGVLAGWLIALIPWLSPAADASRIGVIVFLTYLVGIGQFSHVIAGSADVLYNVFDGSIAWSRYASDFLLPTMIGNTLGGVVLVACLNYGQVATE
jgi:formate/nitrite transporter FocA (FNT family)